MGTAKVQECPVLESVSRAGVKCRIQDVGCGEMSVCKMWGKFRELPPEFTHTNTPRLTISQNGINSLVHIMDMKL